MKAPSYQRQEEVRPVGTPGGGGGVPSGAFGAPLGEGLRAVSGGLEQISHSEAIAAHLADTAQVSDLDTQLSNYASDTLANYKQKEGKNAISMGPPILEAVETMRNNLAKNLQNPNQERMFKDQTDHTLTAVRHSVNDYTTQQVKFVQDATDKLSLEAAQRAVAIDPNNDQIFQENVDKMRNVTAAQATRLFGPGSVAEHKTLQDNAFAQLVETRLSVLAAREDAGGIMDFWSKPGVRESLGSKAPHYEGIVKEVARKSNVYNLSQSILKNNPLAPDRPDIVLVNEKAAMDQVHDPALKGADGRLITPTERDALEARVLHEIKVRADGQSQQNGVMVNKAMQAVLTGGITSVPTTVKDYLIDARNGGDQLWYRTEMEANRLLHQGANTPPTETQRANYGRLQADIAANPAYWGQQDPSIIWKLYMGNDVNGNKSLTIQQMSEAYTLLAGARHQMQAQQGQGVGPTAHNEILRQMRVAWSSLKDINPQNWPDDKGQIFNRIATIVLQKEQEHRRVSKEAVSPDQYEKWITPLLRQEGVVPKAGWLGMNKSYGTYAEYLADTEGQKKGPFIPNQEYQQLQDALRAGNRDVTPENVLQLYMERHKSKR